MPARITKHFCTAAEVAARGSRIALTAAIMRVGDIDATTALAPSKGRDDDTADFARRGDYYAGRFSACLLISPMMLRPMHASFPIFDIIMSGLMTLRRSAIDALVTQTSERAHAGRPRMRFLRGRFNFLSMIIHICMMGTISGARRSSRY